MAWFSTKVFSLSLGLPQHSIHLSTPMSLFLILAALFFCTNDQRDAQPSGVFPPAGSRQAADRRDHDDHDSMAHARPHCADGPPESESAHTDHGTSDDAPGSSSPGSPSDSPPASPSSTASVSPPVSSRIVQVPPAPDRAHHMHTRLRAGKTVPKQRTDGTVSYTVVRFVETEPRSLSEALQQPRWKEAMEREFSALKQNQTWRLVPPRRGLNVIDSRWVYNIKRKPGGSVDRFKARPVAKGFKQRHDIDYDDTYSPVIKPTTIRVILSLTMMQGWHMRQLDVDNAFLHGYLEDEVYMVQPLGYVDKSFPTHLCKLEKSLYGLKQAPRAWFDRLSSKLQELGFVPSKADVSLFVYKKEAITIYILVCVDDIIGVSSIAQASDQLIVQLRQSFPVKDLGRLGFFQGTEVKHQHDGFHLSQQKYITDLLAKTNMIQAKTASTPMSTTDKLSIHLGVPLSAEDATRYRSTVGAL
jgi:histone deacetylase 1/2